MKLHNILETVNVVKVSPSDTLSFALNKLASAHDAAFVFTSENKYMGVINPYYCVIKTSSPSNAKVENALYHAPKVKLKFPISKIAQLMIESKIHHLPVFDDRDEFKGIVTARGLLKALENLDIFTSTISDLLGRKKLPLITIFEDDSLASALQKFKTNKVSKLVVVSKEMRLRGILSYYDLISYLASPKKREKQDRAGDKVGLQSKSVRHFLKTYVLTLNKGDYLRDALHLILEKKIGSVVIVDDQSRPINIITTKDLLSIFVRESSKENIQVTSKNLSPESRKKLGGFFERLKLGLRKESGMDSAKILVQEDKSGGLFKVVLSLFPKKGAAKVIKEEGKNLTKVLNKVKKKEEK